MITQTKAGTVLPPVPKVEVLPPVQTAKVPPARKAETPSAWEEATLPPPAHGTSVRWLQARLNVHGARLIEDGDFGLKSHTALRTFQKANAPEEIEKPWPRNAQDEASVVWPKTVAALSKGK